MGIWLYNPWSTWGKLDPEYETISKNPTNYSYDELYPQTSNYSSSFLFTVLGSIIIRETQFIL